ncbi:MAG: Ppx/GppA family phosphatase [Planctomycetaceae bacterium]|nr:Ppx/GppA family phosphatase [Planctomycetaceae bacterium]
MENKQYYLSPDLNPRLAAIDIGTNSIRLIVAEGLRDGKYRILDDEKDATRLGKNLSSTGRLDPGAVEASIQALRRMTQIAAGYQVREVRAIATCAVREAVDGPEFCRRALEEVGLTIDVVSAGEEARLAFYGVLRAFDLEGKNVCVVDIGGGSTEIVLASNKLIEAVYTTPLGTVRMSELYGGGQTLTDEDSVKQMEGIDRLLRKHTRKPLFVPSMLIGSGGTFTSLAAIVMASKGQSDLPVRGYQVTRAEVHHLWDRLRKLTPKARRAVPGLSPDRVDIIVAGLAIIDAVMRRFQINVVHVHAGGVRDGLLLTMVDDSLGGVGRTTHDRGAEIRRFAARCGVDQPHCEQVARLAVSLCEQLAERFGLTPEDQAIVEAAAQLQDVGYLINYDRHHKHSYHLILNSRLPGFQPHELELIANVVRYHRGSTPKKKHDNFRHLARKDQQRVRQRAAILRLAGGFDRSHSQQVQGVEVRHKAREIEMRLVADQLPDVDLWGAHRRSEFFEEVFRTKLKLDWRPTSEAAEAAVNPAATNGAVSDIAPAPGVDKPPSAESNRRTAVDAKPAAAELQP